MTVAARADAEAMRPWLEQPGSGPGADAHSIARVDWRAFAPWPFGLAADADRLCRALDLQRVQHRADDCEHPVDRKRLREGRRDQVATVDERSSSASSRSSRPR